MTSVESMALRQSFQEAECIQAYWTAHYQELLAEYPEEFVAVRDGVVVGHDVELAALYYDLAEKGLNAAEDVAIEYVSANRGMLLL
ncbi:MAG: hypothetical protein AB7T37_15045 [Dehalococcoidia bacterium]